VVLDAFRGQSRELVSLGPSGKLLDLYFAGIFCAGQCEIRASARTNDVKARHFGVDVASRDQRWPGEVSNLNARLFVLRPGAQIVPKASGLPPTGGPKNTCVATLSLFEENCTVAALLTPATGKDVGLDINRFAPWTGLL